MKTTEKTPGEIFGEKFKNKKNIMTPNIMKTVHVIFENPEYNYVTKINGTDAEIKKYFVGRTFNMGGIRYDHKNDKEIEIDDLQKPVECVIYE